MFYSDASHFVAKAIDFHIKNHLADLSYTLHSWWKHQVVVMIQDWITSVLRFQIWLIWCYMELRWLTNVEDLYLNGAIKFNLWSTVDAGYVIIYNFQVAWVFHKWRNIWGIEWNKCFRNIVQHTCRMLDNWFSIYIIDNSLHQPAYDISISMVSIYIMTMKSVYATTPI